MTKFGIVSHMGRGVFLRGHHAVAVAQRRQAFLSTTAEFLVSLCQNYQCNHIYKLHTHDTELKT